MAKKLFALSDKDRRLVRDGLQRIRGGRRGQKPGPRRRRWVTSTHGVGGSLPDSALLTVFVPANTVVKDAGILEGLADAWFFKRTLNDEGENEEDSGQPYTKIAIANPQLYSPIRGSEEVPVRVFGFIAELYDRTDENGVDLFFDALFVTNVCDIAIMEGHETNPINSKSQGPFHLPGSNAYRVDGGPCVTRDAG